MSKLTDVLTLRRMIAPTVLQTLFWAAVGGIGYGSYVLYALGGWAWHLPLIIGTLAVRVFFEMGILAFRVYDRSAEIRDCLPGPGDRIASWLAVSACPVQLS